MEWKIGKGGAGCARCSKSFEEGEIYFSTIHEETEGVRRSDYCAGCFDPERDCKEEVFWRTRKSADGPVKRTVNFEILREIFFKMLAVQDQAFKEMAYLLALILIRKRYLKLKEFVTREGVDFMTVRRKAGDPLIFVEVPFLRDEDIAPLRDKLSDLLDADLDDTLDITELRERIVGQPAPEQQPGA